MAFDGGEWFGEDLLNELCCEARPGGEKPCIDLFDPDRRDWDECGFVGVEYDVPFLIEFIDVVGL